MVRETDIVIDLHWNSNKDLHPTQKCHFEWPSDLEWLSEIFSDTKHA